ncbi:MAG: Omp28-related outer membrane protein [Ignavibacteria bacterium]|nr:Omp28-related outer membrane protein [Ignavibacteria bacterium]MCC7158157.1 Omp28-related outer membrane protein [Ignavibacteria bacterium]
MKYISILVLALIISAAAMLNGCESNDVAGTSVCVTLPVNKKGLLEFFTNAGCNPCIAAHNYLDEISESTYDTSLIIISYHTRYPYPFDSLYRANISNNQGRSDYYGIGFTPQGRLDGVNTGQFSAENWGCQINQELNTQEHLKITLSKQFDPNIDSGSVTAVVTLVNALPANDNVIHFVITENNISYITSPNGITNPNHVMRNMITGNGGETISVGSGVTVTKSFGIAPNWNEDECYIIVFVQNPTTKQVFGVEKIKVN